MEPNKEKINLLRTGAELPENRNDFWNKEQDKRLEKDFYDGKGITEIAVEMGRTEISVFARLHAKGLFLPQSRYRSPKMTQNNECKCATCKRKDCKNCGMNCFKSKKID